MAKQNNKELLKTEASKPSFTLKEYQSDAADLEAISTQGHLGMSFCLKAKRMSARIRDYILSELGTEADAIHAQIEKDKNYSKEGQKQLDELYSKVPDIPFSFTPLEIEVIEDAGEKMPQSIKFPMGKYEFTRMPFNSLMTLIDRNYITIIGEE